MDKKIKIGLAFLVILVAAYYLNSPSNLGTRNSLKTKSYQNSLSFSEPTPANIEPSGVSGFSKRSMAAPDSMPESAVTSVADSGAAQIPNQTDKKNIKNGDLMLKVESADRAAEKIGEIAKSNGGEVFASNFYQSANNVKSGYLTVRVPVANFEKTFGEMKKVATLVVRESTTGQDVTEQYSDLKAQLSNRQAEEQSFLKILQQAQKIDDVLAVTRELARVRGNIEQLQGQIKFMDSQTDMSTIMVNLTEDSNITVVDSWRPWQEVKDSFNSLIKGLQEVVNSLIRFVIVVLPLLVIWGVIIWIAYLVGKKIYSKMKE